MSRPGKRRRGRARERSRKWAILQAEQAKAGSKTATNTGKPSASEPAQPVQMPPAPGDTSPTKKRKHRGGGRKNRKKRRLEEGKTQEGSIDTAVASIESVAVKPLSIDPMAVDSVIEPVVELVAVEAVDKSVTVQTTSVDAAGEFADGSAGNTVNAVAIESSIDTAFVEPLAVKPVSAGTIDIDSLIDSIGKPFDESTDIEKSDSPPLAPRAEL